MSDSAPSKKPKPGQASRIVSVIILGVTTTLFFVVAVILMSWATGAPEFEVDWESGKAKLNSKQTTPPIEFRHDEQNDLLIYRGKMSDETRDELLKLSFMKDGNDTRTTLEQRTYPEKIHELAFKSNAPRTSLWVLLLITAFGGVVGVQARSISYFVLHACVLNDLCLRRWWPWYFLRPLLGLIFGPLVALLILTEMGPMPGTTASDALTMFVLSVLVGLVASMFFEKLVQMAQTLFGLNSDDSLQRASPSLPDPVLAKWKWDSDKNEAAITWDESTDAKLHHYEIRMTAGEPYADDNYTVLGVAQPGTPEFGPIPGLDKAGAKASCKVFVILTNDQKSGSNTVTVERPA